MSGHIREFDAKRILQANGCIPFTPQISIQQPLNSISLDEYLANIYETNSWLSENRLVVKPDVLLKRRGKEGLVLLDASWEEIVIYLKKYLGSVYTISTSGLTGVLTHFLIEPFLPHPSHSEFYIALRTLPNVDELLFSSKGGINVGDVDSHALKISIPLTSKSSIHQELSTKNHLNENSFNFKNQEINGNSKDNNSKFEITNGIKNNIINEITKTQNDENEIDSPLSLITPILNENNFLVEELLNYSKRIENNDNLSNENEHVLKTSFLKFVQNLYKTFCDLHVSYLEINPLVYDTPTGTFYALDAAMRLDSAADYLCDKLWKTPVKTSSAYQQQYNLFPAPFGRLLTSEEKHVKELDGSSGASLKLTVVNPKGRIWTMIAGGGASVIYTDTICELGYHSELANYGEYSGAPTENATYDYAKTILSLVTAEGTYRKEGKCLILGGGIANFTSIVDTFGGIITALKEFQYRLHDFKVKIFVRRGGPNYQDGLKMMKEACENLDLPTRVFGPETYMTDIITYFLEEDVTADSTINHLQKQYFLQSEQNKESISKSIQKLKKRLLCNGNNEEISSNGSLLSHHKKRINIDEQLSQSDTCKNLQERKESWHETCMEDIEKNANFNLKVENILAEQTSLRESHSPKLNGMNTSEAKTLTPSTQSFSGLNDLSNDFLSLSNHSQNLTHDIDSRISSSTVSLINEEVSLNGNNSETPCILTSFSSPPISKNYFLDTYSPWFDVNTKCFIWGLQTRAVQEMLDFDHVCGRQTPSVSAIIYEFSVSHLRPFYFGTEEIFIPICQTLEEAVQLYGEGVSVLINFASLRSAASVVFKALKFSSNFNVIATIAEGIPERVTRKMNDLARRVNIHLIGPATVGGIKPGAFRIGNTGGTLENIMNARLYRGGSVGLITKSGGMLNELNNMLGLKTNGVCEAVAIGGDRFPGTSMLEHALRFEKDDEISMFVVLGELGGNQEYMLGKAISEGLITKPVVCWCVGTCAPLFSTEVTFGHAGAWANGEDEHAEAKNNFLRSNGAIVPYSFHYLGSAIELTFKAITEMFNRKPLEEPAVPRVPMDYAWAKKLGLVRRPKGFVSSISDDRGEELLYAGWPVSKVVKSGIMGVGGVISLLWFKRPLPEYCYRYLERILMLTADHGPAVCGAHNTIVTARAGKDLISSLISGLCTIGDRFGGACDMAAHQFLAAYQKSLPAEQFVKDMRLHNKLIMGIGHKIKSANNPDMRVELLYQFCKQHFKKTDIIDYAKEVEKITTKKKDTLILNVDGLIGASMCDMLYHCGAFTDVEALDYIENGCINGLFVLGRSIGFIGHYLDQKRLKQGLYRHDVDDISYVLPDVQSK